VGRADPSHRIRRRGYLVDFDEPFTEGQLGRAIESAMR
jgi:hypothetical protein